MKTIFRTLAIILTFTMGFSNAALSISPGFNAEAIATDSIAKSVVYKNASAWYAFNGNGIDSIGNNNLKLNHVTFVNDPIRGQVAEINSADTGYMEFTKNPVSGEQFTISTWFFWKSNVESWQVVFEFANQNTTCFYTRL